MPAGEVPGRRLRALQHGQLGSAVDDGGAAHAGCRNRDRRGSEEPLECRRGCLSGDEYRGRCRALYCDSRYANCTTSRLPSARVSFRAGSCRRVPPPGGKLLAFEHGRGIRKEESSRRGTAAAVVGAPEGSAPSRGAGVHRWGRRPWRKELSRTVVVEMARLST